MGYNVVNFLHNRGKIVPLETYQPKYFQGPCDVTITPTSFKFSVAARDAAQLLNIHWMRVHLDRQDRLIVFEPIPGLEKGPDLLKLGTTKSRGYKSLTAKGLIAKTRWIQAVAVECDVSARKFEMKKYPGSPPPLPPGSRRGNSLWFIQLMPAFEESVVPSRIHDLSPEAKGIYRYRKGDDVIYIGKGLIRDRYNEIGRDDWEVSRIEYSILSDDQKTLEWESWWICRFQREHNGNLPLHNHVRGHGPRQDHNPLHG